MVYIVAHEALPHGMAATNRMICYGKALAAGSCRCQLLTTTRTEPPGGPVRNAEREGAFEGVSFKYIPKRTVRPRRFIMRRLVDAYDWAGSLVYVTRHIGRGDAVLLYMGNHHVQSAMILLISKIKGFKVARELCEYPSSTMSDSWLNRLRRWVDLRWLFPLYDGFVAISQALVEVAERYGSKRAKIIKVPILVDPKNAQGKEAHIHPRPYIFHGGTMTERKDAIISTMRAFAMACNELGRKIDFIIAGPKSGTFPELRRIIAQSGIGDNVIFIDTLPHDEVIRYQNGASLCVLNKNNNIQNRCGFSTKLGEILLSATPVITTTVGEANNFLEDGVSAYITEPHKPELIARQIVRAFTDEPLRLKIAAAGRQIALDNFAVEAQGPRLARFFREL